MIDLNPTMNDLIQRVIELKSEGRTGSAVHQEILKEGYVVSLDKVYRICKGVADQRRNRPIKFTPEEQAEKNRNRARLNMRRLRSCPQYREKIKERNKQYYNQYIREQ